MSDRKVFIPHKETYDDLAESPTFRSYPMGDYRDGFANYNGSGQAETTDHLDIDPNTGYLRHVVSMSDSLNSLALKYHVKVAQIKSANSLWSESDLYTRKNVLIPTTTYQFAEQNQIRQDILKTEANKKLQLKENFSQIHQCDHEVAEFYLSHHGWDLEVASDRFLLDQDKPKTPKKTPSKKPISNGTPLRMSYGSLDSSDGPTTNTFIDF